MFPAKALSPNVVKYDSPSPAFFPASLISTSVKCIALSPYNVLGTNACALIARIYGDITIVSIALVNEFVGNVPFKLFCKVIIFGFVKYSSTTAKVLCKPTSTEL